ncbi:hypothetical protein PO550_20455, partial [Escherichia coli]
DRNRSHWSTSKTPSYTKSVSWQHHPFNQYISTDYNYTFLLFCVMMLPLLAFYRLVYFFWAGMMPAFFMPSLMCA